MDATCVICLEEIDMQSILLSSNSRPSRPFAVLACRHPYHLDCITNAVLLCRPFQGLTCPLCRERQPGNWKHPVSATTIFIEPEIEQANDGGDEDEDIFHLDPPPGPRPQHRYFDDTEQEEQESPNDEWIPVLEGHLRCLYIIANERYQVLQQNRLEQERKLTRANAEEWGKEAVRRICRSVRVCAEEERGLKEIMDWTMTMQVEVHTHLAIPSSRTFHRVQRFLMEQLQTTQDALTTLQGSQSIMSMPSRELSLSQRIGRLDTMLRELTAFNQHSYLAVNPPAATAAAV